MGDMIEGTDPMEMWEGGGGGPSTSTYWDQFKFVYVHTPQWHRICNHVLQVRHPRSNGTTIHISENNDIWKRIEEFCQETWPRRFLNTAWIIDREKSEIRFRKQNQAVAAKLALT